MQLFRSRLLLSSALMALMFLFVGCLKDECRNQFTIYRPIYQSLSTVRNQMKWEPVQPIKKPGKVYLYGKFLLLNDVGQGIHVFDNTNPARPQQLGFLRIGGNVDMAIRNNVLYADSYADLVVFPIENWAAAKPAVFRDKVFADRSYYWGNSTNADSIKVVVGYETKDTIVDCETVQTWNNCRNCMFQDASGRNFQLSSSSSAAPTVGTGGSMARFTLVDEYLYAVTLTDLNTFNVADPLNPVKVHRQQMVWGIETIYPFANKLFIGSMTGMFIFDLANPAAPAQQGRFDHARVCDPVIAEENFAYVTLRSGNNQCNGFTNQLDVLNISNVSSPVLLKTYRLTNPHGLSKDGDRLFICDGKDGLKIFDATTPSSMKLLKTIGGMGETFDVIAQNNVALVVASGGLYQFDYSNRNDVRLISKIATTKR